LIHSRGRGIQEERKHQIKYCSSLDVFDGCFLQFNKRCKKYVTVTGDILKESLRETFI